MARVLTFFTTGAIVAVATTAFGQAAPPPPAAVGPTTGIDPKFKHETKVEEKKEVEVKVTGQLGFVQSTGNARNMSFSTGFDGLRNDGRNKFTLNVGALYARTANRVATDTNADGFIGPTEISRPSVISSKAYGAKLRYDRFLTDNNAMYASGQGAVDEPAGKDFFGGGQGGYSRQIYKDERHEALSELGYDFTYESYVNPAAKELSIHSLRAFLGYNVTLAEGTNLASSFEALMNLNEETTPTGKAGAFDDTRLTGKVALTARVWKDLNVRFGFTAKYDNVPAALPAIGAFKFEPGFVPLVEKLDTVTEIGLLVNFL